jgi:hypothetical protein
MRQGHHISHKGKTVKYLEKFESEKKCLLAVIFLRLYQKCINTLTGFL